MPRILIGLLLSIAAVFASLACDYGEATDGTRELRPGVLEHFGDPVRIEIPPRVAAGAPFLLTVHTYGGGCLEEGPTEEIRSDDRIVIRPLDRFVSTDGVCTSDLRVYAHEVSLTLEDPGVVEILVQGVRKFFEDGRVVEEPLAVERSITVEP